MKWFVDNLILITVSNKSNILQIKEFSVVSMALKQFERHVASLNDRLHILWNDAMAANNEIDLFMKKLEANNVKQFLDVDIVRLSSQV